MTVWRLLSLYFALHEWEISLHLVETLLSHVWYMQLDAVSSQYNHIPGIYLFSPSLFFSASSTPVVLKNVAISSVIQKPKPKANSSFIPSLVLRVSWFLIALHSHFPQQNSTYSCKLNSVHFSISHSFVKIHLFSKLAIKYNSVLIDNTYIWYKIQKVKM